jgi:hypothetical protein
VEPVGAGIVCPVQDDPFHVSAKFVLLSVFPTSKSPTASQKDALTHETLSKYVEGDPDASAWATSFQADPFHSSPNGTLFWLSYPTLMQNVEVAHDTPSL